METRRYDFVAIGGGNTGLTAASDPVAQAKVVTDAASGRILGAHLYGPSAGEEIHVFALALRFGIPAEELRRFVWGYPTFGSTIPHTV
jgi:glutathione reductase (NADPH)